MHKYVSSALYGRSFAIFDISLGESVMHSYCAKLLHYVIFVLLECGFRETTFTKKNLWGL